ncbi:MAG: hypothetical protein LH603_10630 [Pseudonocardia sp.]|nr:hypothetical protein [Pseudonocardia sp.]
MQTLADIARRAAALLCGFRSGAGVPTGHRPLPAALPRRPVNKSTHA